MVAVLFIGGAMAAARTPHRAARPGAMSRVGEKLFVLWGGAYWPATVIGDASDARVRIRYDGYGAEWDENVGADRIKHRAPTRTSGRREGEQLFVWWGGALWPAHVLGIGTTGRAKIRYDGYGEEWDEEVAGDRIGFLTDR